MSILSFIGYFLMELFRKKDNWRQTSSTLVHIKLCVLHNEVLRRKNISCEVFNKFTLLLLSHDSYRNKVFVLKNIKNVLMKLRKIKKELFRKKNQLCIKNTDSASSASEASENVFEILCVKWICLCLYFLIGFLWSMHLHAVFLWSNEKSNRKYLLELTKS